MLTKLILALLVCVALAVALPAPDDDYYRWGRPSFSHYRTVSYNRPRYNIQRVVIPSPSYNLRRVVHHAPVVRSFHGNYIGDHSNEYYGDNDRYDD